MREVEFEIDGCRVSTEDYEKSVEKYIGQIVCIECKKKAWYVKSFAYRDIERIACFSARHLDGCDRATSILIAENLDGEEQDDASDAKNADILVNLDKTKHNSIEVSTPANKHTGDDHHWDPTPKAIANGTKSSEFPTNKSLRQILSYLAKNPNYGEGKNIRITADSGRELINGALKDYLVEIPHLAEQDYREEKIFWGEINNFKENEDGSLWLNYGSYKEPSLILSKGLKEDVMRVYRLGSLERFQGSHFIIFGVAGITKNGKTILRSSMPKYMNFINYRHVTIDKNESSNLS
ncbi:hypothetical protein MACH09_05930 [Vibrio sp. MACH09]|uniref:hypothetical protein n=1 Tax=Vibrio sp. MACH09 TaxID=3025122 RepID=UPI002792A453|nr:hypothetical protein [Vibrio sp. MACH09]GLO60085.1 hypothetical protein MACH09_05930 [Vibrio sp. MACH09]